MNRSASFYVQSLVVAAGITLLALLPFTSSAQTTGTACSFSVTLEMGVVDDSVRCLQEYLNSTGFELAGSGPGSPGNETDKFGSLTEAAVIEWQRANDVSPAMGIFGPVSQAKYESLQDNNTSTPTTPLDPDADLSAQDQADYLQSLVEKLTAQVAGQQPNAEDDDESPEPVVAGASTDADSAAAEDAERALSSIMKVIEDAQEQIHEVDTVEEQLELREDLDDVTAALFALLFDYFDGDYDQVNDDADDALDDASDVLDDAGGESAADEAEDILDDVKDLFDEIEELIEEAEDRDVDVNDAPDLLDEAEELIEDAEDAYADRIYRQAVSDALDAEELLEDARDEIELESESDVERKIEDVKDRLEEVEEEIDDADDDGVDTDEAEDYLDDAERSIARAEIALDDNDYEEASEYADEAEDALDDALDALERDDLEEEAEEAIEDAWDEFRDAEDEIDEADDDGEDVDEAEDLMDEAEDLLDEAEDAFDDEDFDEAIELAEEAEELIEEALDEL